MLELLPFGLELVASLGYTYSLVKGMIGPVRVVKSSKQGKMKESARNLAKIESNNHTFKVPLGMSL